jgi:glutathione S-transferase
MHCFFPDNGANLMADEEHCRILRRELPIEAGINREDCYTQFLSLEERGYKMEKLIVHQIVGSWGLPSISPFCLKLETYLRMVDLPFEKITDPTPLKAPKRKLPYIEHEGKMIGDSNFLIDYLNRRYSYNLNARLTTSECATATALLRLLEENLYWTMVYDRWMVERNWAIFKPIVLGLVPAFARPVVARLAKRGVWQELVGHGIGRHSQEEIHQIGIRDMNALADFLADKPFFMGEEPTEIDASAYGLLANILEVPIDTPVKAEGQKRENLLAYCQRMQERYFA